MDKYRVQNPVLLITYKRTDTLILILERLKIVKPSKIYIASNAHKNPQEYPLIMQVRELLESHISWNCEVCRLYRTEHLNAKHSISSTLSWFFSLESKGIILEDDCLPSLSFFRFCDELLERYENSQEVFMISGWSALDFAPNTSTRTLNPKAKLEADYFFSKYNHIWGWASWRRAWEKYQLEFEDFNSEFKALKCFDSIKERRVWYKIFKAYSQGKIDTWDYPWTYSIWKHNALCIYPKNNMIQNIGFNRLDSTNTTGDSHLSQMPSYELHFPLKHPNFIQQNKELDRIDFHIVFNTLTFLQRIRCKILKVLKIKSTKPLL